MTSKYPLRCTYRVSFRPQELEFELAGVSPEWIFCFPCFEDFGWVFFLSFFFVLGGWGRRRIWIFFICICSLVDSYSELAIYKETQVYASGQQRRRDQATALRSLAPSYTFSIRVLIYPYVFI